MDSNKFTKIVDNFLTKNEIHLLITLPEGTEKATIKNNVGGDPTINLFILLQGLITTLRECEDLIDVDDEFIDGMLSLVKEEVLVRIDGGRKVV